MALRFRISDLLLPKRVGWERAIELTENCLPLSANRAKQSGLIDEVLSRDPETFRQEALSSRRANATSSFTCSQRRDFVWRRIRSKSL